MLTLREKGRPQKTTVEIHKELNTTGSSMKTTKGNHKNPLRTRHTHKDLH